MSDKPGSSRRDFFRGAAASAVAAGLTPTAQAQQPQSNKDGALFESVLGTRSAAHSAAPLSKEDREKNTRERYKGFFKDPQKLKEELGKKSSDGRAAVISDGTTLSIDAGLMDFYEVILRDAKLTLRGGGELVPYQAAALDGIKPFFSAAFQQPVEKLIITRDPVYREFFPPSLYFTPHVSNIQLDNIGKQQSLYLPATVTRLDARKLELENFIRPETDAQISFSNFDGARVGYLLAKGSTTLSYCSIIGSPNFEFNHTTNYLSSNFPIVDNCNLYGSNIGVNGGHQNTGLFQYDFSNTDFSLGKLTVGYSDTFASPLSPSQNPQKAHRFYSCSFVGTDIDLSQVRTAADGVRFQDCVMIGTTLSSSELSSNRFRNCITTVSDLADALNASGGNYNLRLAAEQILNNPDVKTKLAGRNVDVGAIDTKLKEAVDKFDRTFRPDIAESAKAQVAHDIAVMQELKQTAMAR